MFPAGWHGGFWWGLGCLHLWACWPLMGLFTASPKRGWPCSLHARRRSLWASCFTSEPPCCLRPGMGTHSIARNLWPPALASPRACLLFCEPHGANFRQTKLFHRPSRIRLRHETLPHSHQHFQSRDHRTFYINLLHQLDVLRVELTGPLRRHNQANRSAAKDKA